MAGMVGADPEELDALAQRFRVLAGRLDSGRASLGSQIHNSPWAGPAAEGFRHDWDGHHSRVLTAVARSLGQAATALTRNANEQRQASGSAVTGGHGVATSPGPGSHDGQGTVGGLLHDLLLGAPNQLPWAKLLMPGGAEMLAVGLMPGALKIMHINEIRLGDGNNHVLISSDGTISVKAQAIHSELTFNQNDSSFKAQFEGLGLEHTKDDAWGVLATPGIDIGSIKLSAGLDVTYNPHTGVVAPSGEYQVGLGHLIETDASIHRQWNPATGDLGTQVSLGGEVLGARHEVHAAEYNDQFVSTSETDSVRSGPVTVSHTHSQSLTPDGSFVESTSTTEAVAAPLSLDTTYFALKTDPIGVSHSNTSATSAMADGSRATSSESTNSGGW